MLPLSLECPPPPRGHQKQRSSQPGCHPSSPFTPSPAGVVMQLIVQNPTQLHGFLASTPLSPGPKRGCPRQCIPPPCTMPLNRDQRPRTENPKETSSTNPSARRYAVLLLCLGGLRRLLSLALRLDGLRRLLSLPLLSLVAFRSLLMCLGLLDLLGLLFLLTRLPLRGLLQR